MQINFFFQIIILIISVMAHEIAHGAAAYAFGDSTAKNHGRLTLNPLKHIDLFGSIILPFILFITTQGSFLFGWAKPVPFNPYNFRNRRLGEFCVAIAGIITNFLIAVIFACIIKFAGPLGLAQSVISLLTYIVLLNVTLGVFNLIPIPPLDGSKILFTLVPYRYEHRLMILEKYGFYFLIFFVVFFGNLIFGVVSFLTNLML